MRAVQCTCDRRVRPVSAFPNAGRKVTVWTRESQHGRLFEELNERQNHRQIGVYNGGRKVSRRKRVCRRSDHTLFTAAGNADCKAIFESFVIAKKCVSKNNFCVTVCVRCARFADA